jgi:hypothetical protein
MLNTEQALKQDRLLRALTGMNRQAFESLLLTFTEAYEQSTEQKPRKRAMGGGRKALLKTNSAKLFFVLFYFKCYPTFDLLGFIFGFDRSQAHYWVHRLQPVLELALGKKMSLPERKLNSVEDFVSRYPGVKRVMIDGTERRIQRPKDKQKQKSNYSGKKKHHTRKHLAAVDENKRVLVLSKAREGKVHDKRAHDEDDIAGAIPEEIPIEVDSGFLGLQKQYANIHVPQRKPKNGELSESQKEENRLLSSSRVVCENAFAGVKRYSAVSQIYRNRIPNFDDRLMLTAVGLWNFYLMAA